MGVLELNYLIDIADALMKVFVALGVLRFSPYCHLSDEVQKTSRF